MRKFKLYMLPLAAAVMLTACDSFLGNKPKGMTIPSQCEDYQKLYNDITSISGDEPAFLTDDIKLINSNASASDYSFINKDDAIRNMYSFQPGQLYVPGTSDYFWNGAYSRLFTYNIIINDIMSSEGGSEKDKLRTKAEALISRAFEYFYLVNVYGAQYDPATASTDFGVPYIKKGSIAQKVHRNTVQEVYDMIFADIEEALPNLSDNVNFTTHPNKTAAHALMAKVYHQMGQYDKALAEANIVMKEFDRYLNLNDYGMKIGVTWDRVFLKEDPTQRMPHIDSPEAIFSRFGGGSLHGQTMASEELRELFKKDLKEGAKDLRKEYFYSEDSVNMGRTDYFPGECAYVLYHDDQEGLTTVENYLIAAECEARIGSKAKAMEYVNRLRANRIEGDSEVEKNDGEVLDFVLEERRRELAMRGCYRYFDLKRLNKEAKYAKTVTHSADGETWTLAPNDPKWIFPICNEILDFNPDMPQYDRN